MNRKYTIEQEIFIIKNHDKFNAAEMAEKLGVEEKSYRSKLWYLKDKYSNGKSPTTNAEKEKAIKKLKTKHRKTLSKLRELEKQREFVLKNYKTMKPREMARKLKTTNQAIYTRIRELKNSGEIPELPKKRPAKVKKIKPVPNEMEIPASEIQRMKELEKKINELDKDLVIGRKYRISRLGPRSKHSTTEFVGKLIGKYERYYVFQGKYRESFLKQDFILEEYTIEEA